MILVLDFTTGTILHAAGVMLPAMEPNSTYRTRHEVYHHGMIPNAEGTGTWGDATYQVFVNSLAMKDSKVREVPLKSAKKRVLLMGDSFTEGVGVNFEQTYAGRLAGDFEESGLEFLNGGISSYSPIIYLRKTKYLIDTVGLQVDHVSVGIDMSDIFNEVGYWYDDAGNVRHKHDKSGTSMTKRFLAEHTVLIGKMRVWIRQLRKGAEPTNEFGTNNHHCLWANDDKLWDSYGKRGMELALKYMTELHEYLSAKGIGMNVFVYPWPDQIERQDLNCRQVVYWKAWSQECGVDFMNLFPDFIGTMGPEETLRKFYIPGDVHWNVEGHKLVADRLGVYFRGLR